MRPLALTLLCHAAIGALLMTCTTNAQAQWRPGGVPVAPVNSQDLPRVAPDGEGGMYIVWRDHRTYATTNADVYIQRITKDGVVAPGWPALGIPVAATEKSETGWVAPDGYGGAFVVWVKLVSVVAKYDLYIQRILPDGSTAPGWPADGVPVCLAPEYQEFGHLGDVAGDGEGGAYVAWTDFRNVGVGDVQVYISRITADGLLAEGWAPDGTMLIQNQPGTRSCRRLLEAPGGDVYVLFGDSRLGTALGGTYALIRMRADGTVAPGWPADGLPLLLGGTGGEHSGLVSDGAGGAIAGWNDYRNGVPAPFVFDYDIYAQHVFADGTLDSRWPRDGAPICDDPAPQYNFTMDADGAGGAVFAWEDARGDFWRAYGHRIRADGTPAPGWPEDGLPLSSTISNQTAPFVVADGTGGLFAFWDQYPTGRSEIGFQHIVASGERASGWPENGLAIGSSSSGDNDPYAVSDGKGGALVAYLHQAPLIQQIYAQRIGGDGPVSTRVSFLDVDVRGGVVTLRWHAADAASVVASVERRGANGDSWSLRGTPSVSGRDGLEFVDVDLAPGIYAYRLRTGEGASESFGEEITIEVAASVSLGLAGFRPNPAVGVARVHFALPDDRPATVELVDLRGRRLFAREVGSLGPGTHSIPLGGAGILASGVYWIRLTHPERTMTTRGVITR